MAPKTDLVIVMIRYIKNIDISFFLYRYINISYSIVLTKKYQIFWYITISFIHHNIFNISRYFTPEVHIFITALL